MTYETYEKANAVVLALYQKGEYAETMALLDKIRPHFSEHRPEIDYLRSCMAVRLDDRPHAYKILDDLREDGIWLAEILLRQSPSYKTIQGDADFEKIVARHTSARETEEAGESSVIVLAPEYRSSSTPLLVHMHGNGSRADQEASHFQAAVDAGWLVALPGSKRVFWKGGGAFWRDHEPAQEQLTPHLEALQSKYEVGNLVFSGFSMGAEVAMVQTLKSELAQARGFLAVAPGGPMMDAPEKLQPLIENAAKDLRGVVLMSETDHLIPQENIRKGIEHLIARGVHTQLMVYPDEGHVFPTDFAQYLEKALGFILGK